jgi:hypothetical protein
MTQIYPVLNISSSTNVDLALIVPLLVQINIFFAHLRPGGKRSVSTSYRYFKIKSTQDDGKIAKSDPINILCKQTRI